MNTTAASIVTDVTDIVVTTIQDLLAGIGAGILSYLDSLVLLPTGELNTVGVFIFVFLGISAAFGLASLVFNMIRRRG
jgi:hypothetical protein